MANKRAIPGEVRLASDHNAMLDGMEMQSARILGRGVVSGLAMSPGTGLTVAISSGVLNADRAVALGARTVSVGASQTSYVFVDETGAAVVGSSDEVPGPGWVCLGRAVSSAAAVTSCTLAGRMETMAWSDPRTLRLPGGLMVVDVSAGRLGFGKSPARAFDFAQEVTAPGVALDPAASAPANVEGALQLVAVIEADGPRLAHVTASGVVPVVLDRVLEMTLTADWTMPDDSRPRVRAIASGANRSITLPGAAGTMSGSPIEVRNVGATYSVAVLSSGGTTLATVVPGGRSEFDVAYGTPGSFSKAYARVAPEAV